MEPGPDPAARIPCVLWIRLGCRLRRPLGSVAVYSDDRVFVRVSSGTDAAWQAQTDSALATLAGAGHPVIDLATATDGPLGAEFFRWEFATAIAGAVLGINPFAVFDVGFQLSFSAFVGMLVLVRPLEMNGELFKLEGGIPVIALEYRKGGQIIQTDYFTLPGGDLTLMRRIAGNPSVTWTEGGGRDKDDIDRAGRA